jgi:hypothetical protein
MFTAALRSVVAVAVVLVFSFAPPPPAHGQGACPNGTEVSQGVTVCQPYQSADQPPGATARCKNGYWSFTRTHIGACSGYGGVDAFLDLVVATPSSVSTTITTVASAAAPAVPASPSSKLAGTGVRHALQFVELAVLLLGLGSALVLEVRARDSLDRLRRR